MTTICLLSNHLTNENHLALLEAARHCRRREVELQVAALRPLPPVPSTVRKLPTLEDGALAQTMEVPRVLLPSAAAADSGLAAAPVSPVLCSPSSRAVVAPLAPERYKVQITITQETHDKLRRVQDLLRHSIPDGDPAVVFDRALTLLLADLERKKLAHVERPRAAAESTPGSRHVPAAVRREVWRRDEGRCAFVGTAGRCAEHGFLEFHHVVPFAEGGPTTTANLQLRCRAHNLYEATKQLAALFEMEPAGDPGERARQAVMGQFEN